MTKAQPGWPSDATWLLRRGFKGSKRLGGIDSTLSIMSESSYQYVLRRSQSTGSVHSPRRTIVSIVSIVSIGFSSRSSTHSSLHRTLSANKAKLTCAKFSSAAQSEASVLIVAEVDISGKHPLWLAVGTEDGCIHTFRFKDRKAVENYRPYNAIR